LRRADTLGIALLRAAAKQYELMRSKWCARLGACAGLGGMCNEQGGGAYFAVADRLWRVDRAGSPCTTVCKLPGTLLLKGVAKSAVPHLPCGRCCTWGGKPPPICDTYHTVGAASGEGKPCPLCNT
jgi:hypothetical protein